MSYKTRPRSIKEIRNKAEIVRSIIQITTNTSGDSIDILRFVENEIRDKIDENFNFIVCTEDEMKSNYGTTYLNKNTICIREDVYYRACDGNSRDLFTIAHELGHLFLHSNQNVELARSSSDLKLYEDAEWQANTFAAELLMPAKLITECDTHFTLMNRFGVSYEAADIRLKKLGIYNTQCC